MIIRQRITEADGTKRPWQLADSGNLPSNLESVVHGAHTMYVTLHLLDGRVVQYGQLFDLLEPLSDHYQRLVDKVQSETHRKLFIAQLAAEQHAAVAQGDRPTLPESDVATLHVLKEAGLDAS